MHETSKKRLPAGVQKPNPDRDYARHLRALYPAEPLSAGWLALVERIGERMDAADDPHEDESPVRNGYFAHMAGTEGRDHGSTGAG